MGLHSRTWGERREDDVRLVTREEGEKGAGNGTEEEGERVAEGRRTGEGEKQSAGWEVGVKDEAGTEATPSPQAAGRLSALGRRGTGSGRPSRRRGCWG